METDSSTWTLFAALNRWALYSFMLLGAGSGLFILLTPVPARVADAANTLGRIAALVAALCFVGAIGFGGAEIMTGSIETLLAVSTWQMGAGTSIGTSAAIGATAMLLLWCGLQWRIMLLIAAGAAGGLLSFLVTGHAATASPVWLTAPAVAVHLLGAAYWIGALYPLYRSATDLEPPVAGAVLIAFSNRAMWLVSGIVASGVVISWVQLTTLNALWTTSYGDRLSVKILLFGAVLGLAAYNKLLLTPGIAAGAKDAALRLTRIIRVEFLLILLILGAAVSLTLTEPPRGVLQGHGSSSP